MGSGCSSACSVSLGRLNAQQPGSTHVPLLNMRKLSIDLIQDTSTQSKVCTVDKGVNQNGPILHSPNTLNVSSTQNSSSSATSYLVSDGATPVQSPMSGGPFILPTAPLLTPSSSSSLSSSPINPMTIRSKESYDGSTMELLTIPANCADLTMLDLNTVENTETQRKILSVILHMWSKRNHRLLRIPSSSSSSLPPPSLLPSFVSNYAILDWDYCFPHGTVSNSFMAIARLPSEPETLLWAIPFTRRSLHWMQLQRPATSLTPISPQIHSSLVARLFQKQNSQDSGSTPRLDQLVEITVLEGTLHLVTYQQRSKEIHKTTLALGQKRILSFHRLYLLEASHENVLLQVRFLMLPLENHGRQICLPFCPNVSLTTALFCTFFKFPNAIDSEEDRASLKRRFFQFYESAFDLWEHPDLQPIWSRCGKDRPVSRKKKLSIYHFSSSGSEAKE